MDAINGTGIDRLLYQLGGVAVLANRPGAAPVGLNRKGVDGHVGAVATANADSLVNPDSLLTQSSAQQWFVTTTP
jgi:hypothetical protein